MDNGNNKFSAEGSNKKYSSIGEVMKILNIQAHQLRYMESILPGLFVRKIRNRRYYTNSDIEYLRNHLAKSQDSKKNSTKTPSTTNLIKRINHLIHKFRGLSLVINKLINPLIPN